MNKRPIGLFILILAAQLSCFGQEISQLPVWRDQSESVAAADWLLHPPPSTPEVYRSSDSRDIILYNGLLSRKFRITPNVACIDFKNISNGQQLLRAVKPEAKVIINHKTYNIGGLAGQTENAYLLPAWVDSMRMAETDFPFKTLTVAPIAPFINWACKTWAYNKKQATGKMLSLSFESPLLELKGVIVTVNYELYDGMPLLIKWISIENKSNTGHYLDRVVNEILALVEEESAVVGTPEQMKKQHGIYVETNYAFNNAMRYDISDQTTHGILHVSNTLPQKGMLLLYNPTKEKITRTIQVPLYYTGLKTTALVKEKDTTKIV